MHIISTNPDGTVTMTMTKLDLEVLGAAVWAAKEEDTETLYNRFYPEDNAPYGITAEQFSNNFYDITPVLKSAGVDMG